MGDQRANPSGFGARLRRRREEAGLSLDALSRITGYSKGYLSKLERGVKRPSIECARRCDHLLSAQGSLASLGPSRRPPSALPESASSIGEIWRLELRPDGRDSVMLVDEASDSTAETALLGWSLDSGVGRSSEPPLAEIGRVLEDLRTIGHGSRPALVIPMLVGGLHLLRQLAGRASARSKREVLRLATRFADYTGWMAQETGDERAALWWTDFAMALARAAEDSDSAAYALVRKAELALYRGDWSTAISLVESAQQHSRDPVVLSIAAQREAQGRALSGDERGCRRALERARRTAAAEVGRPPQRASYGSHSLADPIAFAAGWSLYDLGQSEACVELLSEELQRLPEHAHRMRARCAVRLARALAGQHRVAEACLVIDPVLGELIAVDSATIRVDLRELSVTLNRWHSHGAIRRIQPALAQALTH
ncbi:helix-turn-helix transcriptional regulator [Cryptosporangium minutisporangium]|uniref:Helix-turn-helix transcriptional regulator n=1 Tax=Cryptosporangium minutisporangium TaxID=113569 RepID=A0ABP6SUC7_9ACTN